MTAPAPRQFDLAVLGGGSGGLAAAQQAARHGARVVMFEPSLLGGTCVNHGCVPKKAMWLAAQAGDGLDLAAAMGFRLERGDLHWAGFVARREAYIQRVRAAYRQRLADLGIELIPHAARLGADGTVLSGGGDVQARHRLIATGGRSRRLDLPGFALGGVSDDVFSLQRMPRRIAVVGGGYIGVEMASLMHGLGSKVTLFVRDQQLLSAFDPDLAAAVTAGMRRRGVDVRLDTRVEGVDYGEDDLLRVLCAGGQKIGGFDWLLWALGRVPNSNGLGLDACGVRCDERGRIIVDERQDTGVPGIHAVGDVCSQPALTPVAIAAGRQLADRLFGNRSDARVDLDNIPTVIFAQPPAASCGLSEPAARERHGERVRVHETRFLPMREALAGRDEQVLVKLVCLEPDERVIGLHLAGPGVDEILQGFAVAMNLGATRHDFNRTIAIHPSSAEEVVLLGRT
ncbi:MAG: glutathione-disulfide reductase [Xanthomonadales bacterium]|nr:glutathione-disulfide reductase [Xanthomonadales bacterium]